MSAEAPREDATKLGVWSVLAAFEWCLAIGLVVTLIDYWRKPASMILALKENNYLAITLGLCVGTLIFGTIVFVLYVLTLGVIGVADLISRAADAEFRAKLSPFFPLAGRAHPAVGAFEVPVITRRLFDI